MSDLTKQSGGEASPPTTCARSLESLLAEAWDGRDWHRMSKLEDTIFQRLKDGGYMYFRDGFIRRAGPFLWKGKTPEEQAALDAANAEEGISPENSD